MASNIYQDYVDKYPGSVKHISNVEFVTKKLDDAMDNHDHDGDNSPQVNLSIDYNFASAGGNVFVKTPRFDDEYDPNAGEGGNEGSGVLDDQVAAELRELIGYLRADVNKAKTDIETNAGNHTSLASANQTEHATIESKITSGLSNLSTELNAKINAINYEVGNLTALEKTYEQLIQLIAADGLAPSMKYVLTDYQTIYTQPTSGEVMTGDVEAIVVTAVSKNQLEPIASSLVYPEDVIYYDVQRNNRLKYEWAAESDKGCIYRRITKNGNDIPYDVRAVKFRRYALDASTISSYDANVVYNMGEPVIHNGEVFVCVNTEVSVSPENLNVWKRLCTTRGDESYFVDRSDNDNDEYIIKLYGFEIPLKIDFNNFKDFYTFESGIDHHSISNNAIKPYYVNNVLNLNNCVFTGEEIRNNVVGDGFFQNTIGPAFRDNVVGNYFCNNWIGSGFYYNRIGNKFNDNIVRDNFETNTIGDDFYNNVVESGFIYNTIGSGFIDCIINAGFVVNSIEGNFGGSFIFENFNYNSIGIGFTTNTIMKNFQYNTIANKFESNFVDEFFEKNTVANAFKDNVIGKYFSDNVFGNSFQKNNMISYQTSENDRFRYNTFENGIKNEREWGEELSSILLSDASVSIKQTSVPEKVAFFYQGDEGNVVTGISPSEPIEP